MRVITLKVDDELLQQIDQYAQMENITRSEFIRRALEWYVLELERRRKMGARIAGIVCHTPMVKIRR